MSVNNNCIVRLFTVKEVGKDATYTVVIVAGIAVTGKLHLDNLLFQLK